MTAQQRMSMVDAIFRVQELADYIVPFAIRVACDLKVADLLVGGPCCVDELAKLTNSHAESLYRMLRALACKEIFTEVEPRAFGLTPMAEFFRSDHPLSLRQAYTLVPANFEAWAYFDHTLRTGEAAFPHVHGVDYYSHLAAHPVDAARYNGIQEAGTKLELRAMLRAYPWAEARTVVDLGGNNGAFLAGLLARHRGMRGVLFDLPAAVADAPERLRSTGVADRCEVLAGDFFRDPIPAGADLYVLKRVLYDWADERARVLLRRIRAAMRPDSALVLLDPVIEEGDTFDVGKVYDLLSLALLAGKARTATEVRELLEVCGFTITKMIPTTMFPIVEAHREASRTGSQEAVQD